MQNIGYISTINLSEGKLVNAALSYSFINFVV